MVKFQTFLKILKLLKIVNEHHIHLKQINYNENNQFHVKIVKKYRFKDTFMEFKKNLCWLSFLNTDWKFGFSDKNWVGKLSHKSIFGTWLWIIPNQTSLREKNQKQSMTFFGPTRCLISSLYTIHTLIFFEKWITCPF